MKKHFRIILDVLMLLLTLTLFSKQLISMQYHEIAGLILIALIIVHIVINIRTAKAMCKNFKKVPAAVKSGLVVDILLLFCFGLLGISGILISHTIFIGIASDNLFFKQSHMFSGGLSVILLGVHIGLHICRKPLPVIPAIIVSAAVLCGGIYGITNSSEARWLSIPFAASFQSEQPLPNHEQMNNKENMQRQSPRNNGTPNGQGQQKGKNRQPLPLSQKLLNIIMFLGMILSCTMITYWIFVPKKTLRRNPESGKNDL